MTAAPVILALAEQEMQSRAQTYDQPGGERSMGRAVAAWCAITGQTMTEAQGWLLMALVKLVRLESAPGAHRDSMVDCVAYAALSGEARAREASHG